MSFDRIPAELQALDRWVVWKWQPDPSKPEKPKKPPYRADAPDGPFHASNEKSDDWTTFEQAVAVVQSGRADGIGFALMPPYVGVDLDAELTDNERWLIMLALDSYSELSPSGTGHHVIVKAKLTGTGRHPVGIGVFQVARFWYCTGAHLPELPTTIEERQHELDAVIEQYLPTSAPIGADSPVDRSGTPRQPVDLDDRELLERAFAAANGAKFQTLWSGIASGYESRSQADQALMNMLAFWTDRDPVRMDSLFRLSGLVRDKWIDREDYRQVTIDTAIKATAEGYRPGASEQRARRAW